MPLLVVGGGIMGLWAAVKAERLGIETLLVEADRTGGGASGGLLGALMPHMPDRWSDKKQFQFDALVALEKRLPGWRRRPGFPPATVAQAGSFRCRSRICAPLPSDTNGMRWRTGFRVSAGSIGMSATALRSRAGWMMRRVRRVSCSIRWRLGFRRVR